MKAVDIIFFDVDGTLVDSTTDIAIAMNHVLKNIGMNPKPEKLITSFIGTGVRDLVSRSTESKDRKLIDKAVEEFGEYYIKHSTDNAVLYPHVREALDHFKDKEKYILTNRYKSFAEATLAGLGIKKYFKDIIGGDDENCLKPSACVLKDLSDKVRANKSRSIIVGDMAVDILTGKNIGIPTCWVTYGLGDAKDVEPLKPDYIIDDIIKLTGIIQ